MNPRFSNPKIQTLIHRAKLSSSAVNYIRGNASTVEVKALNEAFTFFFAVDGDDITKGKREYANFVIDNDHTWDTAIKAIERGIMDKTVYEINDEYGIEGGRVYLGVKARG